MTEYYDTYGGLVLDRSRCAYCAAWPEIPCALHCGRVEAVSDEQGPSGTEGPSDAARPADRQRTSNEPRESK